jgi:hypothetical protein
VHASLVAGDKTGCSRGKKRAHREEEMAVIYEAQKKYRVEDSLFYEDA